MPGWPPGWKRTTYPHRSAFGPKTIARGIRGIQDEVRRIGGTNLKIDSDLRLKNDGDPISTQRAPDDKGVVVYFTTKAGRKVAMPCDRWNNVEHNLWAIAKTLEAKRAVERWGTATQDAEYEGYAQLGSGGATQAAGLQTVKRAPHEVLGVSPEAPDVVAEAAYRALVLVAHPDKPGGNADRFREVQEAWDLWRVQHA